MQETYQKLLNLFYTNDISDIQIRPLLNFDQCETGIIKGYAYDLTFSEVCNLCGLDYECYQGSGVWTSATPPVTTGLQTQGSNTFIPASIDPDGVGWFVEVGSICLNTFNFDLIETYIPINEDGFFQSNLEVLAGYKYIRLYSVTGSEIKLERQLVNFPFNCLSCSEMNYLINPQTQIIDEAEPLATYNVSLCELAINLIPLIVNDYQDPGNCNHQLIYQDKEVDLQINKIVLANINYLTKLINFSQASTSQPVDRRGSIPSRLFQFYYPELIYGDWADELQTLDTLDYLEPDCVEDDCLEDNTNVLKSDRSVSNKCCAWLLYALTLFWQRIEAGYFTYHETQKLEWEQAIEYLADYLIKQFEHGNSSMYQGWSDSQILKDSTLETDHALCTDIITSVAFINYWALCGKRNFFDVGYELYEHSATRIFAREITTYVEASYSMFLLNLSQERSEADKLWADLNFNPAFETTHFALPTTLPTIVHDKVTYLEANLASLEHWTGLTPITSLNYLTSLNSLTVAQNLDHYSSQFRFEYQNNIIKDYDTSLFNLALKLQPDLADNYFFNNFARRQIRNVQFERQLNYQKFIDYIPEWLKPVIGNQLDLWIKSLVRSLSVNIITRNYKHQALNYLNLKENSIPTDNLTEFKKQRNNYLHWFLTKSGIKYVIENLKDKQIDFRLTRNKGWNFLCHYEGATVKYTINSPIYLFNSGKVINSWHKYIQNQNLELNHNYLVQQDILFFCDIEQEDLIF